MGNRGNISARCSPLCFLLPQICAIMKLADDVVSDAKPKAKPYKMADGGGLYLLVQPHGSKLWRVKYRFGGKEKTLSLGVYPKVTLADARDRKDEARTMLAGGNDPAATKHEAKLDAAQQKAVERLAIAPPSFRLSITDDALTIQTKNNRLALTAEQTEAVRAFLIATPNEVMP